MKIIEKKRLADGKREIYFFGIRIFSYVGKGYRVNIKSMRNYLKNVLRNSTSKTKILVVIPNDAIKAYERKGQEDLEHYYNPQNYFDIVFVLSPLERGNHYKHNMHLVGVDRNGVAFREALSIIKPLAIRCYGGGWATEFAIENKVIKCPVIVSVHDARPEFVCKQIVDADAVICVSETCARMVNSKGVAKNKILVMYDRVDRKLFSKKIITTPIMKASKKNILCVGRLSPEKNIETLIRSLEYLPDDYHCTIIGRGDKKSYQKIAKKLKVNNKITWISRVPNSVLPLYYSECDCFCLLSLCEGFGIVYAEAAACEAAIVTSDIAPLNQHFKNGTAAILLKEFENPLVVATAIKAVCSDYNLALRMGKLARESTKNFDKKLIESREKEIYESIIFSNGGAQ